MAYAAHADKVKLGDKPDLAKALELAQQALSWFNDASRLRKAGDAYSPKHIAVDSTGNATVVWMQWNGTTFNVWSNRYVVGSGWGTAALLQTDGTKYGGFPEVAVDGAGNATAVWHQAASPTQQNVWVSRFTTSWSAPSMLETAALQAWVPTIAVSAEGDALTMWRKSDGSRDNMWAAVYH